MVFDTDLKRCLYSEYIHKQIDMNLIKMFKYSQNTILNVLGEIKFIVCLVYYFDENI